MTDARALRKINRTVFRYHRKRGEFPTVERVAQEHDKLEPADVWRIVATSDALEIFAGRIVSRDLGKAEPENRDDDGVPNHLRALEDALRVAEGLNPMFGWPSNFPQTRSVNWSRNIYWMRVYAEAVVRIRAGGDIRSIALGYVDKALEIEDEHLMVNEVFPEWTYASWSAISRVGLWSELVAIGAGELANRLRTQLRREVALWRLAGLDRIKVKRRRGGRVVYDGPGARCAGSRLLPKSGPELSRGVQDSTFAALIGVAPAIDRWSGTEERILDAYRHPVKGTFSDLRERANCVAELEGAKTRMGYVVERYRDGSVASWMKATPSLETGYVPYTRQWPDGRRYDQLWLFDRDNDGETDERVRRGHPDLGHGVVRELDADLLRHRRLSVLTVDRDGRDKDRPHLDGERQVVELPQESEVELRVET